MSQCFTGKHAPKHVMAKSTPKKPLPATKVPGQPAAGPQTHAEKLAQQKARTAFAKQARARGEVAAEGDAPQHSNALFTESDTGELTRRRFSLIPDSLLPPDGPGH